jgi:hypothetical protein
MPQLAVAAAGAWLGGATLGTGIVAFGMTGTAIGWAAGSLLGSLLFGPQGPKAQLGDTRAPKIDHGAKMTRVYGTVRVPLNPRWLPDFTPTSQSAGGKGGGGGSEYYTYSSSPLYWCADGTNVMGVSRIWKNGELVWTNRADSDAESLANSADTVHWDEMQFFDGNASQLPWSVYEAGVGSVNADAHRRIACIGFTNLKCGNSPQLPFMEAEIYTQGTSGDPLTLLQSRFIDAEDDDESFYQDGAPGQSGGTVADGVFIVNRDNAANPHTPSYLEYTPAVQFNGTDGVTFECFLEFVSNPNVSYTGAVEIVTNAALASSTYHRFGYYATGGQMVYDSAAPGLQYTSPGAVVGKTHCAVVFDATSLRAYIGGVKVFEALGDNTLAAHNFRVRIGDNSGYSSGTTAFNVHGFRLRQEAVYTGASFTPPTEIPPPDGQSVIPGAEDLADVVSAECLRSGLTAGEIDVTDLVGTDVRGFKCEGTAADAIGQLMGAFYFYCLPGRKLVFRMLDAASIATIQAADTGAGVDQASEVFAGLMRGNDLELPAQVSLTAPNPSADYDPATATSDRIVTVANRIEQAQLAVVFTPAELKGRANANVLDARVAAHTASLSVDDTFAAYEPGDVITHVDDEGNSYITRWVKESYSQGVKQIDLRLFDRSVLTLTGTMSDTYTPALTVAAPAVPVLYLFDTPILRDADDGHGIYATVTASGDWQGAELWMSRDDVTYESVGLFANRGVVGTATELGDFTGWTWDTANSMTVTLDEDTDGLTASTKAAIEADATLNVALVGEHERWEAIRFAGASLLAPDTFLVYDALRGQFGTEHANAEHEAGDTFVLMRTTGIIRVPLVAGDVGNTLYFKAVPPLVALSAVTAVQIVYTAESLKPYAPVDLHAETEDGSTVVSWNRRSRLASTLFALVQPPLGEASESYDVELYDGVTLEDSATVTVPEYSVAGIAQEATTAVPTHSLMEFPVEFVGIRDDLPNNLLWDRYLVRLLRFSFPGALLQQSAVIGHEVVQMVEDSDNLYLVVSTFSPAHPNPYASSTVQLWDRFDLTAVVATNTAGSAGDYQGIAFDGTDVWVSERDSGNLRRLDPATLVSAASHAVSDPGPLFHDSGNLWTVCLNDAELVCFDIGTTSETIRVACIAAPFDLIVVGSLVFVLAYTGLGVYQEVDGSEVIVHTLSPAKARPQRSMCLHDGYLVVAGATDLYLFDETTGVFVMTVPTGLFAIDAIAAADGLLYITGRATAGSSHQTLGYQITATDLTGKTVIVYQNSAAVGRGYPAEVEL